MKARDLAIVLVRIFALWAVLQSVMLAEQVPIAFFNPISTSDAFTRYHSFLNAFNFALYLSLGLMLLYKTNSVADFLVRGTGSEEAPGATASELAILGFGLIGMVVLIDGLENIVQQGVVHLTKPEIDMGVQVIKQGVKPQVLSAGIAKAAMGLFLLLSPAGIARALRWSRDAGKDSQVKA